LIACLGNVRFKGFINRNMVYTEVTRGVDLVIFLGSVSDNPNSQLSIARKEVADDNILTVGMLLNCDV